MKLLRRNCVKFEYIPYEGIDTDLDEDNLHTGDPMHVYGSPVEYIGNISAPSGAAIQTFSGLDIRYSHVIILDNPKAEISETGKIIWNGRTYEISAIVPSLNSMSIAIRAEMENHDY